MCAGQNMIRSEKENRDVEQWTCNLFPYIGSFELSGNGLAARCTSTPDSLSGTTGYSFGKLREDNEPDCIQVYRFK